MKGQQKVVFCRRYIPARMFPSFISQIAHSIPSKFYEKLRFSDRGFSSYPGFLYGADGHRRILPMNFNCKRFKNLTTEFPPFSPTCLFRGVRSARTAHKTVTERHKIEKRAQKNRLKCYFQAVCLCCTK